MYSAVLMLALATSGENIDHGRRGGCSSCWGCSSYSCYCSGSYGWGCSGYYRGCCGGSTGYYGCTGYSGGCCGGVVLPAGTIGFVPATAPATIVVSLPAGARLTVDGKATRSVGERRTLVTPALGTGDTYVYTLQTETMRNGQPTTDAREVRVRAGETSIVNFNISTPRIVTE